MELNNKRWPSRGVWLVLLVPGAVFANAGWPALYMAAGPEYAGAAFWFVVALSVGVEAFFLHRLAGLRRASAAVAALLANALSAAVGIAMVFALAYVDAALWEVAQFFSFRGSLLLNVLIDHVLVFAVSLPIEMVVVRNIWNLPWSRALLSLGIANLVTHALSFGLLAAGL